MPLLICLFFLQHFRLSTCSDQCRDLAFSCFTVPYILSPLHAVLSPLAPISLYFVPMVFAGASMWLASTYFGIAVLLISLAFRIKFKMS